MSEPTGALTAALTAAARDVLLRHAADRVVLSVVTATGRITSVTVTADDLAEPAGR